MRSEFKQAVRHVRCVMGICWQLTAQTLTMRMDTSLAMLLLQYRVSHINIYAEFIQSRPTPR